MTPFGRALLDYQQTGKDAHFTLERDDGFSARIPVAEFFDDTRFSELEQRALDLCHGQILDVGAGAGRHALALQRQGKNVCALDILPEAVEVMKQRGVKEVLLGDVMSMEERTFDTLLMLMNGLGIVGTPSELGRFLHHAGHMLRPGGCILCDSIDVSQTTDPVHVRYREKNISRNRVPGQQFYTAVYGGETSALFPWLHLDFATLEANAVKRGWSAERIFAEKDGHYLAKLTKQTD
jgi:2-polyprenyl-3-methyl-5-hydroxy-6-metoxy-1,4-benzoquinol methylase